MVHPPRKGCVLRCLACHAAMCSGSFCSAVTCGMPSWHVVWLFPLSCNSWGARLACGGTMLLDVGESARAHLVRSYAGTAAAAQQVAGLNAVWINHRHFNHMLGLPCRLAHRPRRRPPLLIIGGSLRNFILDIPLEVLKDRSTYCALTFLCMCAARHTAYDTNITIYKIQSRLT